MVQLSLTSSAASSLAEGAISAPVAGQAMPSFGRRAARMRVNGERGNGSGALANSFARTSSCRARSPTEGFRAGVSMTCSGCVSPFSVASTCASDMRHRLPIRKRQNLRTDLTRVHLGAAVERTHVARRGRARAPRRPPRACCTATCSPGSRAERYSHCALRVWARAPMRSITRHTRRYTVRHGRSYCNTQCAHTYAVHCTRSHTTQLNSAHYRTGPAHALRLTLYTPAGWLRDCPECPLVDTPTLGSAGHTRASTAAFARLIQKEGARAHAGLMRPGLGLGLRLGLGFGRGLGFGLRFGLAPQPWSLTWIDLAAGRA